MPLRSPKMKRFIFGFQRRVWCPKWTPASSIWRIVMTAMAVSPPAVDPATQHVARGDVTAVGCASVVGGDPSVDGPIDNSSGTPSDRSRVTTTASRRDDHGVFDTDAFVADCRGALTEDQPRRAVREVVERAVADAVAVADALRPATGGITALCHEPELTVLHVVWSPHMTLFPHDHRMWAVIGIYGGQEDNAFFRRSAPGARTLVDSGGTQLVEGDVLRPRRRRDPLGHQPTRASDRRPARVRRRLLRHAAQSVGPRCRARNVRGTSTTPAASSTRRHGAMTA